MNFVSPIRSILYVFLFLQFGQSYTSSSDLTLLLPSMASLASSFSLVGRQLDPKLFITSAIADMHALDMFDWPLVSHF